MKAVDGGKFYKEYLLKTSFKGETSEPCNPYYFLFPLNSWSFSFFFFLKQYLPPTTSNDEQLFFCVLLVWSVLHPTPESNMEQRGGKTKSKKREKGPKDIDKKEGGISGGFFLWKIPIFSFLWLDNKKIPWMLFLLTQPGVLKSKSESLNCTICLYPAHF